MANEPLTADAHGFTSQSPTKTHITSQSPTKTHFTSQSPTKTPRTRREQENADREQALSRELAFLQNLPEEPEVPPGGEVYVLLSREPLRRRLAKAEAMVVGKRSSTEADSRIGWSCLNSDTYLGSKGLTWLDLVTYALDYSLQIWLVTEMVQIYAQDELPEPADGQSSEEWFDLEDEDDDL